MLDWKDSGSDRVTTKTMFFKILSRSCNRVAPSQHHSLQALNTAIIVKLCLSFLPHTKLSWIRKLCSAHTWRDLPAALKHLHYALKWTGEAMRPPSIMSVKGVVLIGLKLILPLNKWKSKRGSLLRHLLIFIVLNWITSVCGCEFLFPYTFNLASCKEGTIMKIQ